MWIQDKNYQSNNCYINIEEFFGNDFNIAFLQIDADAISVQ